MQTAWVCSSVWPAKVALLLNAIVSLVSCQDSVEKKPQHTARVLYPRGLVKTDKHLRKYHIYIQECPK